MTNKEIYDLIKEYPDIPLWIVTSPARDSITLAEAKAMLAARRKVLKRAS